MCPSPAAGPDRLAALWRGWRPELDRLAATARPALLPHLRAVDHDQSVDIPFTLALSGFAVPVRAVASALGAIGPEAHLEGWPAAMAPADPDPSASRGGVDTAALAALDGWVGALVHSRIAILHLLQGAPAVDLLRVVVPRWHGALAQPAVAAGLVPPLRGSGPRLFHREGAPEPAQVASCLERMWELADAEPAWDVRAFLLHLAVLWIRPWPGANARLARLLLNTVRSAAGHPWLLIPAEARAGYLRACEAACAGGDAGPFADLAAACAAR